jgi:hypothetical protein
MLIDEPMGKKTKLKFGLSRKLPNIHQISSEILSGNWHPWSNLSAQPASCLPCFSHFVFKVMFNYGGVCISFITLYSRLTNGNRRISCHELLRVCKYFHRYGFLEIL